MKVHTLHRKERIMENILMGNKARDTEESLNRIQLRKNDVQKSRKINRNAGREYFTQKGKIRPAKVFQNKDCCCSKGCIKLFGVKERKEIFDRFWDLGDFNKQNLLLRDTIEREPVKRQRLRNGKGAPRNFSFKYFLITAKGKSAVCKRFFLDTFNISEGRLQRTLKSENPGCDMRGRSTGSRRKIPEEERKSILNHINKFPLYPGFHNIKILHPDLNIRKMFNLYVLQCFENNTKPVNEATYRKIFKKNLNLGFHQPREDACQKCYSLNLKFKKSNDDEEKSKLMIEHDSHLKEADLARKSFQQDQNLALNNPDIYFVFSFDLQKPLPYPRLTSSDAYYKYSLYISNVGCHNFHDKRVHMYLWDETIASRGSKEIASCILKHVENLKSQKHIIAYSSVCTGIKRNVAIVLAWLKIIQSFDQKIDVVDHKFLSSAHTTLPNEGEFEFMEALLRKNNLLFVPQDYYEVLRKCKKPNFIINEMKREDFVSFKPLKDAIFKRLNNADGESVDWMEICWMRFMRNEPCRMFYKTSMEGEFKALDLQPPEEEPRHFNEIQLPPIYEKTRPIEKLKYDDLMDLLTYIPPAHHSYFKSLPHMQIGDE